jgi:hypothetical protein
MALNRNLEVNASRTAVAKKRAAKSCPFKTVPGIPGPTHNYLPKNSPITTGYQVLSMTHVGIEKYGPARADAQNRIKIESECPSP